MRRTPLNSRGKKMASFLVSPNQQGTEEVASSVAIPGLGMIEEAIKRERELTETKRVANVPETANDESSADESMKMKVENMDSNFGTPPAKKKRKSSNKGIFQPKNALMALNEMMPGLQFEVVPHGGSPHAPLFAASVIVNGQTFQAIGSRKQMAKHNVAELALRSMVQFRNPDSHGTVVTPATDHDFTRDTASNLISDFGDDEGEDSASPNSNTASKPSNAKLKSSLVNGGKHPVMLLNEICPGSVFECLGESGALNDKEFMFRVTVDGREFKASGRNKKKARANTAARALLSLFGIRTYISLNGEPVSDLSSRGQSSVGSIPPPVSTQLPQEVADSIAEITTNKFRDLQGELGDILSRRKVLAGVVLTEMPEGSAEIKYNVISIGTGTKFISGEYMSDQGLAVNDCHGEIIARRSLQTFLYSQLELASQDESSGKIFEKKPSGLFGLRKGFDFHLYINTAPCGDGRIFSPHEAVEESDKHPGRKNRGLLRVKLENGEGTIPALNTGPPTQTIDGILGGEKLRTMSCSDKICKWNVVGIQGALLSSFVEPIYLRSVILGSLYHYEHLSRALYQRLGQIEDLPVGYLLNRPYMNPISMPEGRAAGNAPNTSVNWSCSDKSCEVITMKHGKVGDDLQPSRLCKQRMFSRFVSLWQQIKPSQPAPQSYQEAKQAAHDYQTAKRLMHKVFEQNGLGTWVEKPMEQDMFELTV